jgi:transcription elongation factor S-II
MASDERKAADLEIMAANLHKSLGAQEQGAETEGFQCHRCKQVMRFLLLLTIICPRFAC